ncbi:MAG: CoA transferase [Acidobacteria bacterium]|nr:CoA transferase [Acidobacteriota bacterium]
MSMPLEGLRILSVSQFGAGPFGTMALADMGAEIIKIEDRSVGGDVARGQGPAHRTVDSLYFQCFNRNKRSLSLNLSVPPGKAIFHRLVQVSHGVFNNLRGDVPAKLGLTYSALKQFNPAIVCCSLSAYGTTGPQAAMPGYDPLLQASEGYMSVTGTPDEPPAKCGVSVIDFAGGFAGVLGTMAGIYRAQRTGIGCDVDVSLRDTAVSMLNYLAVWYLNLGLPPEKTVDSAHATLVPSQTFRTRDGYIAIFCGKEKFWKNLCEIMDRTDLSCDPRFSSFDQRLQHKQILISILQREFAAKPTAEWMSLLVGKVPCAPVRTIAETLDDPTLKENGMIVEFDHPLFGKMREVGCPIKFPGETMENRPCPPLGHDTEDILTNYLGMRADEVQTLREQGVV